MNARTRNGNGLLASNKSLTHQEVADLTRFSEALVDVFSHPFVVRPSAFSVLHTNATATGGEISPEERASLTEFAARLRAAFGE